MGQNSTIAWTTHTFNPWRGCQKVSAGCAHCYADTMSKRNPKTLGIWGPNGLRVVAAEATWREPVKWNAAAEKAGERHRVFCASMADVFEDWDGPMHASNGNRLFEYVDVNASAIDGSRGLRMSHVRRSLFDLICRTPHLDWLLLTKRPENALRMMVEGGLYAVENPSLPCPQPNLWIGTSVEDQAAADERIPHLLKVPAAVRFLSMEPLLGPVDLNDVTSGVMQYMPLKARAIDCSEDDPAKALMNHGKIHWVIVGGESGHGARPCYTNWIDSIAGQCRAAGVPLFVKQLGANHRCVDDEFGDVAIKLKDSKGGDIEEFPADLRIREMPKATVPA